MPTNTKPIGVAYEDQQLDGAVMGKTGGTAGFYGTTPIVPAAAITAAFSISRGIFNKRRGKIISTVTTTLI